MLNTMVKRILGILLIGILGYSPSHAQSRSLQYYINRAFANSAAIKEQQHAVASSQIDQKLNRAQLKKPNINATGDYLLAPSNSRLGFNEAITNGGLYSALLNVDYPLLTGKNLEVKNRKSAASRKRSEYQIRFIRHNLRQSVTGQYITAFQAYSRITYLQEVINLMQKQENVVQQLAQQGAARYTDLKQLQLELKNLTLQKEAQQNHYRSALGDLNAMIGITDTSQVRLQQPGLSYDPSQTDTSRFMRKFKLDSLNLALQQRVSDLKYRPQLSVTGSSGLNAVKFSGLDNRYGFSVGLHFSLPIYDGHQKNLHRQQTQLQEASVMDYKTKFKDQRTMKLQSLQGQIASLRKQLDELNRQIKEYRSLLTTYQKELQHGEVSVLDYLRVLRNFQDTLNQRVQLRGQRWQLINTFNYWNW